MLKTSKKILSTIMVVIMVLTAVPLSGFVGLELPALDWGIRVSALASSGQCGDNVTYTYDSVTGELLISGEGPMTDYSVYSDSPFYDSNIKSVIIGGDVTTIGNYVFFSCDRLTDVTISNSVTAIGDAAFYLCENLKNITIPDSVTTIGNSAFGACTGLLSLELTKNISYIGNTIVWNCEKLSEIIVDKDNLYYANDEHGVLFNKDMTELIQYPIGKEDSNYNIPYGVTKISDSAFYGSDNLTDINFSGTEKIIDIYAFGSCSKISNVVIPNSVTDIIEKAFCGSSVENIILSDNMTKITYGSFASCNKLKSITIPKSVTLIENFSFDWSDNLESVYYEGSEGEWSKVEILEGNDPILNAKIYFTGVHTHCFTKYVSDGNATCQFTGTKTAYCDVCGAKDTIADEVVGDHVYYEAERIEQTCTQDGKVVYNCKNCGYCKEEFLKAGHLLIVKEYLEASCTKEGKRIDTCTVCGVDVTEVISATGHTFSDWVVDGDVATRICDVCKLTETSSDIKFIGQCGENVYWNFNNDTGELIITGVGKTYNDDEIVDGEYYSSPFKNNDDIVKITIDSGVTSIGSYMFYNCSNLISISIGNDVEEISVSAFNNCTSISEIIIPSTVSNIEKYAFYNCYSLKTVTLSEGLKTIGEAAFQNDYSIKEIVIPDSVTEIGNSAFEDCSALTKAIIGNSITDVPHLAFGYCSSLKYVEFGENTNYIGQSAFHACYNLSTVVIKDSMKSIVSSAFNVCTNIKNVYYNGSKEHWDSISVGSSNSYLLGADIHFDNTDTETYEIVCEASCYYEGLVEVTCSHGNKYMKNIPMTEHSEEVIDEIKATCNMDGYTEGKKCSICNTVFIEPIIIPSTGHNEIIDNEVVATCTKAGLTSGSHCGICGEIIILQKVVPILPHTVDWTITKEATCTNEGEKTGYCTVCGTNVVEIVPKTSHPDADCNKVCDVCFETITGTSTWCSFVGHQMSWVKVQESTCTSYGREIYVCTRADCGYISNSSSLPMLSHTKTTYQSAVTPTCTEPGSTEGVECSVCHMVISEVMDVPPIGHKADWTTTKEATCKEKGEREGYCTVCETSVVETVTKLSHTDVDGDKLCDFCSENMPKISAMCSIIGHSINWVVTKSASCVSEGEEEYMCTRSGCEYSEYEYRKIPALSHEVVVVSATAPTCTKYGNTEGSYCAMCGSIIETWDLIDKIEHEPIESWYIEATCTEGGKTAFACRNCGIYLYEEIISPAIDHSFVFLEEKVSPTCLADGVATYMCEYLCGETRNEPIPATGHTYSEWVELLPATCSERGLNIKICNDCNDIQRQIITKLAHEDENNDGICDGCGLGESNKPDTPIEPDVHKHSYTATVTKVPSCTENGIVAYACICGESYNDSIVAYGHSDADGNGLCDVCGYGEEIKPDVPKDPSENCSCNCHKSGLFNMIFKLILFFQKFLRMNKTCICGVSHY